MDAIYIHLALNLLPRLRYKVNKAEKLQHGWRRSWAEGDLVAVVDGLMDEHIEDSHWGRTKTETLESISGLRWRFSRPKTWIQNRGQTLLSTYSQTTDSQWGQSIQSTSASASPAGTFLCSGLGHITTTPTYASKSMKSHYTNLSSFFSRREGGVSQNMVTQPRLGSLHSLTLHNSKLLVILHTVMYLLSLVVHFKELPGRFRCPSEQKGGMSSLIRTRVGWSFEH